MPWRDLVCLVTVIVGAVVFLYGSNYYDATFGWSGVSLVVAGLVAEIILGVYGTLRKRGS
ncbi:hypothetical protein MUP01_08380 [Candidatus Bathyarchaeota archaeon]|nr:hypothetical protein [Candidatus Bathyarchaeota archaeon]